MGNVQNYSLLVTMPLRYSVVPVLSLMMNFLWLAYRKYEYKYTIIRWTWYIVIRTFVIYLSNFIDLNNLISDYYLIPLWAIISPLLLFFLIVDFIQFVFSSRKFYLHLKSREKEIQLFYFDNKAYLDSKYLRIHFKITTILVGIALFFFTFGVSIDPNSIFSTISFYIDIPNYLKDLINSITLSSECFLFMPSLFLCKLLITLNYL